MEGAAPINQERPPISTGEVRTALNRMKNGKVTGHDDIPVWVWKCLGDTSVKF